MTDQRDEQRLSGVLKSLVEGCQHPERLIELCYWSTEDQLADVMRHFIALPPEVRAAFHAFLLLVKDDPGSVTARIAAANGELSFSAPKAVELARSLAGAGPPPPFLH